LLKLSDQFFAFNFIEDYKLLAEIVDLIFEKVIEEPHLSDLFSDLCKKKVYKKVFFEIFIFILG